MNMKMNENEKMKTQLKRDILSPPPPLFGLCMMTIN